jgi:ATP-dependent helicase/DNAse subunit B
MPATVHVLCGPAGSGKTHRLLEQYRRALGRGIGAALWLGPTQRYVEALRPRLLSSPAGCLAPNLLTFQDFAEEVIRVNDPAARPLTHLHRRLLAEDIVADLHTRGQLPHFHGVIDTRGFAETVFAFLAELKQNEIWPEHFSAAVAQRPGDDNAAATKDQQCLQIYTEYQRRLLKHHLYDLEGRLWYARDLLDRGQRRPFEQVRAVFVDGFTDFTRTQREVLENLARWVEELWIALPDEPGQERAELFTRPRATLLSLGTLQPDVEPQNRLRRDPRPAGLIHLERQLFRPRKSVLRFADASGLLCIEAPGMVGETRLVAREITQLLAKGVGPGDILVSMRDVLPYADLVREVFAEYRIPVDVESTEPLHRNPAVATLLRLLRLPDEDWLFAGVTALLRSTYFRPDWPETRACPDVAQHAEALLRLLGEPRGRYAYLRSVQHWAEKVHPGLEDEQAEESLRRRKHELAKKCGAFLERFFAAWDSAAPRGTLAEMTAWVRGLADDLGLTRAAGEAVADADALSRLWDELEHWAALDLEIRGRRLVERGQFLRLLAALAAETGVARTERGPGRVRVLSAPLARGLQAPYVFVMGLGERSFPRLAPDETLFDEQERQALRQAGLAFPSLTDLMPDEMLLFYRLVTSARRQLVLSYPAVDERGQALLPCSFLSTLRDCFEPGAIPLLRRRMLIEGFDRDLPLSAAEARVRAASDVASGQVDPSILDARWPLRREVAANLKAAAEVARQRFEQPEHSPYDGLLRDPAVIAEAARLFTPERVLSPTALESYVACPFRFFLGNVLHLQPLDEPSEEIESTERGLAFHRALSRLHRHLRDRGIHRPEEVVDDHLLARLDEAVRECASRTSPAGQVLWELEGKRLKRLALRYRGHWQKFLAPWLQRKVEPRPEWFEVSFGLPPAEGETVYDPLVIRLDGLEVRISGRIDRVDIAELPDGSGLGFWIIDYKTGNPAAYTGSDLREFRKLQLTLYALAVEQVLLGDKPSRPLGLAYWLVGDTGPKVALPAHPRHHAWYDAPASWPKFREGLCSWVATLIARIRQGEFPLRPRSPHCTQTCDFGQICRISQSRSAVEKKQWDLSLPMIG